VLYHNNKEEYMQDNKPGVLTLYIHHDEHEITKQTKHGAT